MLPAQLRSSVMILAIAFLMGLSALDSRAGHPVTVAEAAQVLDLATFPMMEGGKPTDFRCLASLVYAAPGEPRGVYTFQKRELEKRGWKELPGSYLSDESCSGAIGKNGFIVSVVTSPSYDAKSPGTMNVQLINHGNVDLNNVSVPSGTKLLYSFPVSVDYVTEAPAKETADAIRALLMKQGWQPYGTAGDSQYFKQNAIKLDVSAAAAPGQDGKTVIQLSSELLSVDLPAPPNLLRAQYSDSTKALSFDADMTPDVLVAFYRDVLGKAGWKPTTETPIKAELGTELIFTNAAKDLLNLKMQTFEGKVRGTLAHQTAVEVAEEKWRFEVAEAHRKAEAARSAKVAAEAAAKNVVHVEIAVPAGAKAVERSADELKFELRAGTANTAVQKIRADLLVKGWKADSKPLSKMAGGVTLSKQANVTVTIVYVDTGSRNASITITTFGAKIDQPKGR